MVLFIFAALGTLVMSILGTEMTLNPPESKPAKWICRGAFILLGAFGLVVATVQYQNQEKHETKTDTTLGNISSGVTYLVNNFRCPPQSILATDESGSLQVDQVITPAYESDIITKLALAKPLDTTIQIMDDKLISKALAQQIRDMLTKAGFQSIHVSIGGDVPPTGMKEQSQLKVFAKNTLEPQLVNAIIELQTATKNPTVYSASQAFPWQLLIVIGGN